MKTIIYISIFLCFQLSLFAQKDFIQIEHNQILGTLTFISAASNQPGTAPSYKEFIDTTITNDNTFQSLSERFAKIDVQSSLHRERFPEKRHPFTSSMDLLWIASANATSIDDFATRTIGVLSPNDHTALIDILKETLPYYTTHVWKPTEARRVFMEQALLPYTS